jgi:transposase-like protein
VGAVLTAGDVPAEGGSAAVLDVNPDGEKDVRGPWIEQSEGAKFWLKAVTNSRPAASMIS